MKMFRAMIRDISFSNGACEVLLNSSQVVFAMPHPFETNVTIIRMTGEANVYQLLAPFADVREAIEETTE